MEETILTGSRRGFLKTVAAGAGVAMCGQIAKAQEDGSKPPNVVLLISDDQTWNDYSFTGHPHIKTPRIDQLAKESLTFTRGYVTAPRGDEGHLLLLGGLFRQRQRQVQSASMNP